MEASAATIRDSVRRKNAVTLNHQQAIYTEKLRPSFLWVFAILAFIPFSDFSSWIRRKTSLELL